MELNIRRAAAAKYLSFFFENTFHLKQNHWEKPLSVLWYEIIQDVKKKSKKIIKQPQKQNRMILFW